MNNLEVEIEFEELSISLYDGPTARGIMIYGRACLEGDEDGFSVNAIRIDGTTWFRPGSLARLGKPTQFEDELFARIAAVIENPKTAIGKAARLEWDYACEALSDMTERSYSRADEKRENA